MLFWLMELKFRQLKTFAQGNTASKWWGQGSCSDPVYAWHSSRCTTLPSFLYETGLHIPSVWIEVSSVGGEKIFRKPVLWGEKGECKWFSCLPRNLLTSPNCLAIVNTRVLYPYLSGFPFSPCCWGPLQELSSAQESQAAQCHSPLPEDGTALKAVPAAALPQHCCGLCGLCLPPPSLLSQRGCPPMNYLHPSLHLRVRVLGNLI